MSARECFCGCGIKVKRRHVPYNTLGVEMTSELEYWGEIRAGLLSAEGGEFGLEEYYAEGLELQADLREYMHTGDRPATLDLKRAGMWNEFSRKERKKFDRKLNATVVEGLVAEQADGEVPNGSLSPTVLLERLPPFFEQEISEDLQALMFFYFVASKMPEVSEEIHVFLLNIAWSGYCARTISIEELETARADCPVVTSQLETASAETGNPEFLTAAGIAAGTAGLIETTARPEELAAAWVVTPGVVDAEAFERLAVAGTKALVAPFQVEREIDLEDELEAEWLLAVWGFGYFLRANEQYSSNDDLFSGASAYVENMMTGGT